MAFNIRKRGKLTYYYRGEHPLFSNLVTEDLDGGDLKIYFAGFTGGESAASHLKLPEIVSMDPDREIPLVFRGWEAWLQEAGICDSLREIDFMEMHVFGCQPKSPNPLSDPAGYAAEQDRLRKAYARAYGGYFQQHLSENGVPARFTVHLIDVPDQAASYEFYTTALYQPGLTKSQ
jgi:hypothetical protein